MCTVQEVAWVGVCLKVPEGAAGRPPSLQEAARRVEIGTHSPQLEAHRTVGSRHACVRAYKREVHTQAVHRRYIHITYRYRYLLCDTSTEETVVDCP